MKKKQKKCCGEAPRKKKTSVQFGEKWACKSCCITPEVLALVGEAVDRGTIKIEDVTR